MVFTFSMYLIGHNLEGLKLLSQKATPAVKALAEGLYYLLPNLGHLDIKNQVVYGAPFSPGQWITALLYGGAYMAVALAVAMAAFSRREM